MSNRLLDFIQRIAILFDNQFGFRAKHSTDFAVLNIIDKIQKAIDERDFSCGIFLDLSKAFDTVNHEILKSEYQARRALRAYCLSRPFYGAAKMATKLYIEV